MTARPVGPDGYEYPLIKLKAPENSIREGLLPVPDGMMAWKNKKNDFVVLGVGYYADPEKRTEAWWREATKNLRPDQVERELLINFDSRGGEKVFPFLEREPHKFVRPATDYRDGQHWKIPKHWRIIAGLDYGGRNPTSIHFYAIDEDGTWHSVWEHYEPSHYMTISEILKQHPLWPRVIKTVCDPSIFKKDQNKYKDHQEVIVSIGELLQEEGVHNLERANNDRISGLQRVLQMFGQLPGLDDPPTRLLISEDCANQYTELSRLVYKEETTTQLLNNNPSEDVVKKNDHTYDDLRYALMSWDFESKEVKPDLKNPFALSTVIHELDQRDKRKKRGLL